ARARRRDRPGRRRRLFLARCPPEHPGRRRRIGARHRHAARQARRQPYRTELRIEGFGTVEPPPPVPNLAGALVALVTEAGLVPHGNPDRLETWNASKWFKYPIAGLGTLERGRYEAWHGGCDTSGTNDDPDRAVPLDAARRLERDGIIGRLYDHYYVTTG